MSERELFIAYRNTEGLDMANANGPDAAEDHVFIFPPTIDPGTYAATFAGCHEFSYVDKATKEDVTLLSWSFEIAGAEDGNEPIVAEGVTSLLLSARSKGFAWLRAIAPEITKSRETVAASELIGRGCIVVLEDKDDDIRVVDVMAPLVLKGKGEPIKHEDQRP